MNHIEAKAIVDSLGITPAESLFVRAVSWHETNYGQSWKEGYGAGSHNWGAITTLTPGSPNFQHGDSSYSQGKYVTWFKGYPDDRAGANDVYRHAVLGVPLKMVDVAECLRNGDLYGAVQGMYSNGYYMGLHKHDGGAGDQANVSDYFNAITGAIDSIVAATGESRIIPLETLPPGECSP